MKRRLEHLWEDTVPLGGNYPHTDPEAVRRRVNAALNTAPPERRSYMRQKFRLAALAAAIAVVLAGSALAVAGHWDVLDVFFRGDTTPVQSLVDRESRSVSDENYTFTVDSSVSDEDIAYLVVRVDALNEEAAARLYDKYFINMDTFSVYPVSDPEQPVPEDLRSHEQTGCYISARNTMRMGVGEIEQAATETSRTWQLDVALDAKEQANYLHVRLCYMDRDCTIAVPLSPAQNITLDIGAAGPGAPTSGNVQGGTIVLESVTLSPFTCQVDARHVDGNKEVDPLLFFLLEDGTLRTSGQLLQHVSTNYHSDGTADYSYQLQEVLDLSQLAAVVFDGTAYPLDGGEPYAQAVDPRLYPFQLPLMDRLSERSGFALPLQALCEALDASYTWDSETQTAVCSYRDMTLEITVGSTTVLVNGEPVTAEEAPALQDGTLAVSYDTVERWGIYPFVVYSADKTECLCWIVIP